MDCTAIKFKRSKDSKQFNLLGCVDTHSDKCEVAGEGQSGGILSVHGRVQSLSGEKPEDGQSPSGE